MSKKIITLFFIAAKIAATIATTATARTSTTGEWMLHFTNNPVTELVYTGNYIYGICQKEIHYLDIASNSLHALNKIEGLSSTDEITSIGYSKTTETIIVGYADGNIDLLDAENSVYNIDAIKRRNISSEKNIYKIFTDGRYAYLACGFGIVIIDLRKEEIKESYFIGTDNSPIKVYDLIVDEKYIYAATENGLYFALKNAHNLNDYRAWQTDSLLGNESLSKICKKNDTTIFFISKSQSDSINDVLFECIPNKISNIVSGLNFYRINSIRQIKDGFLLTVQRLQGERWEVVFLNAKGEEVGNVEYEYSGANFDAVLADDKTLFVGHESGNILKYSPPAPYGPSNLRYYSFSGPSSNDAFSLSAAKNEMLVCGGQYNSFYAPLYKRFSLSGRNHKGEWKNYRTLSMLLDWGKDAINALEDPLEVGHYYVSSGVMGLLEFRDGQFVGHYKDSNSALSSVGDECRVYGLAIGERSNGNLWMTNPFSQRGTELVVKRADGTWKGFDVTFLDNSHRQIKVMVDYWNQVWVLGDRNLFVFRENGDNLDGLKIDINRGNELAANDVFDIFEDEKGFVWLGTNRGVRLIETHKEIFTDPVGTTSSVDCKTILVRSGEYVIELLKNDVVTSIAMDGAYRKWLGTASNGVFLVSDAGTEEILHFTAENSPLLSNNILDIAVDGFSGDVYISTDQGLCSYRGTATAYYNESEKIVTYPNPVKPDHSGNIYIRNVPHNSKVKITDISGNLIFQGQADGNQLVWNGYSQNGKRPTSGILLVFATAYDVVNGTSEKKVGKIFFIAK
ncbi:MAG: hypothetical protein LBQ31_00265 [Bacteroidales bacterium]|jgi:WD40 repeat protein|nr:hypothetical protein [Bacteroidales bacterium]